MTDQPTPQPPEAVPGQPTLGDTLGLGPAWRPAPASWKLHPLAASDGSRAFALVLHTVGGSAGAAMTEDNLRELVRQAQELLSGVIIPPAGAVAPMLNGGNRAQRRHPGRG